MRRSVALILVALCAAACDRPASRAPSGEAPAEPGRPAVSIKVEQAMDLINEEVEPLIWDSEIEGGRDRGTLEIELHSLEGPWRWWSRQRRTLTNGVDWVGISGDVNISVEPEDIRLPVEVQQGALERWDVILHCRADPCFRMSGSEAQAEGTQAEVEAALDAPSPVDERIEAVFFPFATQDQAERVARAMNELLALQGATAGDPQAEAEAS